MFSNPMNRFTLRNFRFFTVTSYSVAFSPANSSRITSNGLSFIQFKPSSTYLRLIVRQKLNIVVHELPLHQHFMRVDLPYLL